MGCPINSFDDLKVKFPTTSAEQCDAASNFNNLSSDGLIVGCVGAIDGMLVPIGAPSAKESGNVRAYYSGHYSRYGINEQDARLIDLSINSPGSTHDMRSFRRSSLFNVVESWDANMYLVGDNATT